MVSPSAVFTVRPSAVFTVRFTIVVHCDFRVHALFLELFHRSLSPSMVIFFEKQRRSERKRMSKLLQRRSKLLQRWPLVLKALKEKGPPRFAGAYGTSPFLSCGGCAMPLPLARHRLRRALTLIALGFNDRKGTKQGNRRSTGRRTRDLHPKTSSMSKSKSQAI